MENTIGWRKRVRWAGLTGAIGACALLVGIGAFGFTGDQAHGSPGAKPPNGLQRLTERQCAAARSMLEAARVDSNGMVAAPELANAKAAFELEYQDSLSWIEAGCPPDARRGFLPDPSGKGGYIQIMTSQGFAADGTTAQGGIPLVPDSR